MNKIGFISVNLDPFPNSVNMIKVIPVSHLQELNEDIKQIFIQSFPSDERREWDELVDLLKHPHKMYK